MGDVHTIIAGYVSAAATMIASGVALYVATKKKNHIVELKGAYCELGTPDGGTEPSLKRLTPNSQSSASQAMAVIMVSVENRGDVPFTVTQLGVEFKKGDIVSFNSIPSWHNMESDPIRDVDPGKATTYLYSLDLIAAAHGMADLLAAHANGCRSLPFIANGIKLFVETGFGTRKTAKMPQMCIEYVLGKLPAP